MNRKLLINIHLYLATFFAPCVLLVAISGGLYLVGVKGSVETTAVYTGPAAIDSSADDLKEQVDTLLATAGVADFDYEYVKVKGNTLYTRPTSREHYIINLSEGAAEVQFAEPSLQKRMIELHMGHGPGAFKTLQQAFALGLLLIFLSGLWLGLASVQLRRGSLITVAAGSLVFAVLLV